MQETDAEFGEAHDRYLAGYQEGEETVWCENKSCPNHVDGATVAWASEYGQSWWDPENCPLCHGRWLQDQPQEEDE